MKPLHVLIVSLLLIVFMAGCGVPYCIGINSKIATPGGEKLIQNLNVGDTVLSWDLNTNELTTSTIKAITSNTAKSYKKINNQLTITKDHIIYDFSTQKWVKVAELGSNSKVGALRQGEIEVQLYHSSNVSSSLKVFDISLEGNYNNYFANSILVHNKTPRPRILDEITCFKVDNNQICESKMGEMDTCPQGFSKGRCDQDQFEFICRNDDPYYPIRSFIFYNPKSIQKSDIDVEKYCTMLKSNPKLEQKDQPSR